MSNSLDIIYLLVYAICDKYTRVSLYFSPQIINTMKSPILLHALTCLLLLLIHLTGCQPAPQSPVAPPATGDDYLLLAEDPASGTFGYYDKKGAFVIPFGKYELCMTDTFRTYAVVLKGKDFVVIDRQEQVLYQVFKYDNGPDFSVDGLFRIVQNGKIGYADAKTYQVVIQPQFDCAFPFENGVARVSNNCKTEMEGEHSIWTSDDWKMIDKSGKVVQ